MAFPVRNLIGPCGPGVRSCRTQGVLPPGLIRWQRRTQATVTDSGPAASAAKRAQASLKRFWKDVDIGHHQNDPSKGYVVRLDKRPLKTPSGNPLVLPKDKKLVATLVASEWENQDQVLQRHSLPITSLASRAIDSFGDEATRADVREKLLKYLETDTICFREDEPESLVHLQKTHWDPLIAWAQSEFGVTINTTRSFILDPHPEETYKKLDEVMQGFNRWEMAAMERAVYTSKSFLIAFALLMKRITAEEAAQAANAEVNSQIERWGEVEDSHDVDYHDIRRQLASAALLGANL